MKKKVRFAEDIFAKVSLTAIYIHVLDMANRAAYKSVPVRLSVLESIENPSGHVVDFGKDCGLIHSTKNP
jgi:hypothetical protein